MSRVALIGKNSVEYVKLLIDIWNQGDSAVLIDWHTPLTVAFEMMMEAGVEKAYIQDVFLTTISAKTTYEIETITFKANGELTEVFPDYIYSKYQNNYSRNEAVIIYSSGTTGKSKGIILSHFAISTNADAIIDYMAPMETDCIYIVRSLTHSSTLTGELLVALKTRMKVVLTSDAVPPRYIFRTVQQYSVTLLCLNPYLLSLLCDELGREVYCISSLRFIFVSGAILSDIVYKKAHNVFSIPIYNGYGLSETAPRLTVQRSDCCISNSVGKPIKGVEIIVVDDDGTPVSIGQRGTIHVKTPCLFSGYVSGAEKHHSLYLNWFNTGDVGFIDEYGELHIVDRIDDLIICDAHKVYPSDIENKIKSIRGIDDCVVCKCVCNDTEILGCLYVADCVKTIEIVRFLKKLLVPSEIPKRYVKVNNIPHNSRGKIDRLKASHLLSDIV